MLGWSGASSNSPNILFYVGITDIIYISVKVVLSVCVSSSVIESFVSSC